MSASQRRVLTAVAVFVGMMVLQIAWIISLPPFAGLDELDHYYRAESVSSGQWAPSFVESTNGHGQLVEVPRSAARVGRRVCRAYEIEYIDNCAPVRYLPDGRVLIATTAGRYNPTYYSVVGLPARFVTGFAQLEVMRVTASFLCSLLIGVACYSITLWAKTGWPLAGLAIALTPMVAYTTAVAAPNGVEIAGGLGACSALVGIGRLPDNRHELALMRLAGLCCVPLLTVRTLGPLWFLLIVMAIVCLGDAPRVWAAAKRHHPTSILIGCVVTLAFAGSAGWSLVSRTNSPSVHRVNFAGSPLAHTLPVVPLWIFQSIGVFPDRFTAAPIPVYFIEVLAFGALMCAALTLGSPRLRLILVAGYASCFVGPFILTLAMYSKLGYQWQARYALPFAIGLVVLATLPLDDKRVHAPGVLLFAGLTAIFVAQTMSVVHVLNLERRTNTLANSSAWWTPADWVVVLLVALSLSSWMLATHISRPAIATRPPYA